MEQLEKLIQRYHQRNLENSRQLLSLLNEILGFQSSSLNVHRLQIQIHMNNENHLDSIISCLHHWKDMHASESIQKIASILAASENNLMPNSILRRIFQDYLKELDSDPPTTFIPSKLTPQTKSNLNSPTKPKLIWVVWLSEFSYAPAIIKSCISSCKQVFPSFQLKIIHQDNYHEFTKISQNLIDKFNHHQISRQHFSQLIGLEVLQQNGGLLVDPFLFFSSEIPQATQTLDFFLLRSLSNDEFFTKIMGATSEDHTLKLILKMFQIFFAENSNLAQKNILNLIIQSIFEFSDYHRTLLDKIPRMSIESSLHLSGQLDGRDPSTIHQILTSFPFHILPKDASTQGLPNA